MDENALTIPERLRELLHPWRGGTAGPPVEVDGAAPEDVRGMARERVEEVLADPRGDRRLAERARRHLGGEPDTVGAAAVAEIVCRVKGGFHGKQRRFVEAWVAEHGVAFAACALTEQGDIRASKGLTSRSDDDGAGSWGVRPDETAARWLRTLLASAGDAEYADAVERLAACRRTPTQRLVTAYLVPARQDWVEECCAAPPPSAQERSLLLTALSTPRHLDLLGDWTRLGYGDCWTGCFITMAEGLGQAAAPLLAGALDPGPDGMAPAGHAEVLDALGVLPTDEAFALMVERIEMRAVQAALLEAMERFPVRAVRVLAPATAGPSKAAAFATELLGAHLRRHPELGTGAAVPAEAEAVAAAVAAVPDAPAEALPRVLADPPWLQPKKKRGAKPRALPAWADPAALPQVLLEGRDRALPADATRNLLALLTMSKPGAPQPEIAPVCAACDPESLAEFGWGLFRRWQIFDTPAEEGWVLTALGALGDDGTVRRLTPVIRAWPGESGHAKAVKGLDVLADIGTETALGHLHSISQRVKFTGLRARAKEKIAEVAAKLGLTADELADRLVPDLGLDSGGGMVLDYGPRRFTVGFDERLQPYVIDGDGKRLKALPKPGAGDDAELAPAASKRFTALKKDVRALTSDQLLRLESAMATGRRWTPMQFRELFVGHPLVRHVARRLVWLSEDGAGVTVSFRISEDMTLADASDDPFDLVESARVGIAHPVHLGDGVAVWAEVFADYEILQPFPQLGRSVHALTDAERATGRLERFEGVKVPAGGVRGLARRGWDLEQSEYHGGVQDEVSCSLPDRRYVQVALDPGLYHGRRDEDEDQVLSRVSIVAPDEREREREGEGEGEGEGTGAGTRADGSGAAPDPGRAGIALSEALADLVRLTAATAETGGP